MNGGPMDANFPRYNTAAVQDLMPYTNNARTHSDAQVATVSGTSGTKVSITHATFGAA